MNFRATIFHPRITFLSSSSTARVRRTGRQWTSHAKRIINHHPLTTSAAGRRRRRRRQKCNHTRGVGRSTLRVTAGETRARVDVVNPSRRVPAYGYHAFASEKQTNIFHHCSFVSVGCLKTIHCISFFHDTMSSRVTRWRTHRGVRKTRVGRFRFRFRESGCRSARCVSNPVSGSARRYRGVDTCITFDALGNGSTSSAAAAGVVVVMRRGDGSAETLKNAHRVRRVRRNSSVQRRRRFF